MLEITSGWFPALLQWWACLYDTKGSERIRWMIYEAKNNSTPPERFGFINKEEARVVQVIGNCLIMSFLPYLLLNWFWFDILACLVSLVLSLERVFSTSIHYNSLSSIYLMLLSTLMRMKPQQSFLLIPCWFWPRPGCDSVLEGFMFEVISIMEAFSEVRKKTVKRFEN